MNENNKKYFSTGEFAKLCKVHKKTLFHYDDIDLFKAIANEKNCKLYKMKMNYSRYVLECEEI